MAPTAGARSRQVQTGPSLSAATDDAHRRPLHAPATRACSEALSQAAKIGAPRMVVKRPAGTAAQPTAGREQAGMEYQINSEPRGGHWVAWLTAAGTEQPAGAAILVGQTRAEAEANAQRWAGELAADTRLQRR